MTRGKMRDSDGDILEQLAAIAKKQDELILLFAGRLDWNAAENAARFPGGECPHSEFQERDGRFEVCYSYPVAHLLT